MQQVFWTMRVTINGHQLDMFRHVYRSTSCSYRTVGGVRTLLVYFRVCFDALSLYIEYMLLRNVA